MKIRLVIAGFAVAFWLMGFSVGAAIYDRPPKDAEQLCQTHEKAVVQGCEDEAHALNETLLQCEHMLNVRGAQLEYCAEAIEKLTRENHK